MMKSKNDYMKKYSDFQKDKNELYLSEEEQRNVVFTNYKIVVPTNEDKEELMKVFKHFHDSDVDTDFIAVNQLVHEYLDGSNIVVDEDEFNKLNR